MTNREEVYAAIDRERAYQDRKWGTLEDHPHAVAGWLTILGVELDEAREAWARYPERYAIKEVLQIATVAVACLEQHGIFERDQPTRSDP